MSIRSVDSTYDSHHLPAFSYCFILVTWKGQYLSNDELNQSFNLVQDLSLHATNGNMKWDPIQKLAINLLQISCLLLLTIGTKMPKVMKVI